jgi:uncharacterized membrane protein YbaN (DUF454 family)
MNQETSMEAQTNFVVRHFLPGRLRATFPFLISDKELSNCMKAYLSGCAGITSVTSNHLCGSVTVTYDPEVISQDSLLETFGNITMAKLEEIRERPPKEESDKQTTSMVSQASPMSVRKDQLLEGDKSRPGSHSIWNPWNLAGSILVGVGVVAIFVPLLPTVPVLLLASACYLKGSPKLYDWLMNHKALGQYIREYREGKGVSPKVKRHSITLLWVSMGISIVFLVQSAALRLLLVLIGVAVTVHILRMKTAK